MILAALSFAVFLGVAFGTAYIILRESRGAFPLREEVFRKGTAWHWHIVDRHGDVVAECLEPYVRAEEARAAVRLVNLPTFS